MYRHVVNGHWNFRFTIYVQGSNSTCTYIRIRIKDLIYTRITLTCIFIKIKCYIKISSRLFISFPPLNNEKFFWKYGCFQDIFSFRNLITHIVCRHYVHMMHTKFLQETNQMINTGRDLVFFIYLDKYQLGFILSYVRGLRSRTLYIYQGLSCL